MKMHSELDDSLLSLSYRSSGGGDVFDRYKNDLLEQLRTETEAIVAGVDGPLSLEIARVLLETEEGAPLDLSWAGGGDDPGAIEASAYLGAREFVRQEEPAGASGRTRRGSISG